MQTLRFISAIAAVIAVGVICALLGIYMDKDNFLPKERNYALIGACAVELALVFIIAKIFLNAKKLKKERNKRLHRPFHGGFYAWTKFLFSSGLCNGVIFSKKEQCALHSPWNIALLAFYIL